MFRTRCLLPLLGVALLAAGCVQATVDAEIRKDGSGTFAMKYSVTESVAEAMKEMRELDPKSAEMPSITDIDRDALEKACKENDVTLKTFENTGQDGRLGMTLELEFKSLEGLNNVLESSQDNGGGGLAIFRTADGNYVLKAVKGEESHDEDMAEETMESDEDSSEEPEEFDPEKMQRSMEIAGKMMAAMSELDVKMRVTVPGEIVRSNAMRTEGNTAIWEVNASNMMAAQGLGEPEIVFSGKGVKIDAPLEEEGN